MFQQSKPHYLGKSRRQPNLLRESLHKDLSYFGQKKDFLTKEKPGKVAEVGKYLSATFSMHYGNEVKGVSI